MKNTDNLISISLDTSIFTGKYGTALERQREYAKYFKMTTIIVLNRRKDGIFKTIKENNLQIIPTNSSSRWLYTFDVLRIAETLPSGLTKMAIVTAQDPFITGVISYLISRRFNLPLNVQLHNDFFQNPNWERSKLENKLISPIGIWVLHKSDSIRYVNPRIGMFLKQNYKNIKARLEHIPVAVDIDYFFQKARKVKKISKLITIGRLDWQKNIDSIINALSTLRKEGKDITLTIVGDGGDRPNLERLIRKNNLQNSCRITGFLRKGNVRTYLHQSDLFVLASRYEGWSMSVMEAMAAGLPVIMTNVGIAGDLVINNQSGIVVDIENENQLTQAIREAIENPNKLYTLAKKGQEKVFNNYNKEALVNKWITLLKETNIQN